MKKVHLSVILSFLLITASACSLGAEPAPAATEAPSSTATDTPIPPTETFTPTPTYTQTNTPTETPPPSDTPTETLTPTITPTDTPMDTPTPEPLTAVSNGTSFCRWGPNTVYIASYTVNDQMTLEVHGRNWVGDWIWVRPPGLDWNCWVAVSTVTLSGDVMEADFVITSVYTNPSVPLPGGVSAVRNGNQVTISWPHIPDAPERQYLVEARVCLNGFQVDQAFSTVGTSITIRDDTNCSGSSYGELRGANRLGYSGPVTIFWP